MNAHADMLIVVGHNGLNTPMGIYRSLALGYEILQDFYRPKQALINAFYNMSANFWFAVQRYYIFFILASTYTKKSPLMSENIIGNLNKTHFVLY